jgi:hypothetical protein
VIAILWGHSEGTGTGSGMCPISGFPQGSLVPNLRSAVAALLRFHSAPRV